MDPPLEVSAQHASEVGIAARNQASFLVKCEPPETFNRMQSLHIGNTVQPGERIPDIYNMPANTTNYQMQIPQMHHPTPPPTNPQLFNPMFHYPQEQRPHHLPAYDTGNIGPNYEISVPTYTPQMEVPVVNFAVPAPVISPVVPLPFEPPPPIPVPAISQEPEIPEVNNLFKTELSEDDEELDEEESEISGAEEDDDNDSNDERDSGSRRFRDDTIYDCPICKLRFTSQKKIEAHVTQAHPGEKPYKCPLCELGLTRMTTYKEHMNMHTGEKPFECTVCHEKFGNSKSLYRHREKHETLAEKKCLQCKEEFSTWDDFKEHTNKCNRENLSIIHANTKPGDRPFICNVCGLGLSRIGSLNEHMNTHTGETPYACIWCKDRFPNTKSLSRHREKHDLNNPKCCAKCQKEFDDWNEFKEHVNLATCKVKLNVCQVCNESFTRLPDLEKHFKVYHPLEDKLYSCTLCDKRFSHKNLLNTHMKTHVEAPAFICQICGRQFIGNVQLQRHLCAVHGEKKTYDCPVCGLSIAQLKSLIEHVKTHVTKPVPMPLPMAPPPSMASMQGLRQPKLEKVDKIKIEKDAKVMYKTSKMKVPKVEKADKIVKREQSESHVVFNPANSIPSPMYLPVSAEIKVEQDDNTFFFETPDFFASNDHFMDGVDDDANNGDAGGGEFRQNSGTVVIDNAESQQQLEIKINPADFMGMSTMSYEMKNDIKTEGPVSVDDDEEENEQSSSKKHQARNALNFPATKYPTERLGDLECLECGKRFMNLQNLNSHHIVHTGEKPFECYHCGVRLRYHKSLKRHMRLHIGDKNICCEDPDCNEKFKTKNQLDIHMRQHTDQKRRYTCPLCDKSFFQKKILRQHRKIHGERNYKCEVCGRAFTENSRLREHMKVHTDDKPFLCSECGKNFRTKFSLDLHLKRHNNEARHLCKYCNKGFVVLSELKVHERTHTGEKPFVCPICYKHLSARRAVRAHMRIHTGEKPYACSWPDCPSVFRDKPSLRCHYRTHTGSKPFGCKFCDKHFTTSSNLRNHTARIHIK